MQEMISLAGAALAAIFTGFMVVRKAGDNCTP